MTELGTYLERLGLEQYLDAFVGEGFDTLETLLDIQETDFDALNVKLGHRRKLQRAIAEYRGVPFEKLVAASSYDSSPDTVRGVDLATASSTGSVSGASGGGETKRKYRRHPKLDENAPERPPSAYVIFSNKVREEVKDQNLTFTQIAKLVGERWQRLDPAGKEPYEAQANAAKERYNIRLSTYKKTDAYKEYTQYLAEFKAKHGGATEQKEQKRPRLDADFSASSGGSLSAKSQDLQPEMLAPSQGSHVRGGSTGSAGSTTYAPMMPSPGVPAAPLPHFQNVPQATAYSRRGSLNAPRGNSPSAMQTGRDIRRRGQLSTQSSMSEDSPTMRNESDPLGRTASLSLGTPSATPPLPSMPTSGLFDQGSGADASRMRLPGAPLQTMTPGFGSQAQGGTGLGMPFGQTLPSPTMSEGSWRGRPMDLRGYTDPARGMQPPSYPAAGPLGGNVSLPPLVASDRFSDYQRTLPLPRASPTLQQQPGLSQAARLPEPTGPYPFGSTPRPQQGQGGMEPPLDRSESDAADTLAGLAAGGPRPDTAKPPDPRRQHR